MSCRLAPLSELCEILTVWMGYFSMSQDYMIGMELKEGLGPTLGREEMFLLLESFLATKKRGLIKFHDQRVVETYLAYYDAVLIDAGTGSEHRVVFFDGVYEHARIARTSPARLPLERRVERRRPRLRPLRALRQGRPTARLGHVGRLAQGDPRARPKGRLRQRRSRHQGAGGIPD